MPILRSFSVRSFSYTVGFPCRSIGDRGTGALELATLQTHLYTLPLVYQTRYTRSVYVPGPTRPTSDDWGFGVPEGQTFSRRSVEERTSAGALLTLSRRLERRWALATVTRLGVRHPPLG